MSPHALIPWSCDKSEEDEACGGVLWPLPLPASPSPAHSPQNHIYFALTRWAVLSCWSVWRETDPRRKDRHLTPADRWGTGRHRHATHTVWRPCKTVKKVSKRNKGIDCVGVCDIQAAAGCEKASGGASVCSEEVAAPRWLTGSRGSWSPPLPPVSTNQKRTSETPLTRANTPAMLNMRVSSIFVWLLLSLACVGGRVGVWASEFPDRECCDSAPPPPPHYHTTTSTTPVPIVRTLSTTTTSPPPSFFPIASIAPTGDGVAGVRNCLLARQLCAEDISCRSVLEIIPRLCGPENVACSTVTVNKCLAALRTILGFPYFQPTCLCREPHLDRECNVFREFIFDHPCNFVENRNESPYAVHALPLCEYALTTCEKLPGCMRLYDGFRNACKVKDDQCRMTNTSDCLSAWTKLKMSPMFGCICPNDLHKRKCEKIFKRVHRNPCVVSVIPSDNSSHHAADTQIQSPLLESGHGAGRRVNASRAANVLGNAYGLQRTDPHATGHTQLPINHTTSLQSTCHTQLMECNKDPQCRQLLEPVLAVCDSNNCNREACMSNVQAFYRNVSFKWALEVAFCLCMRSSSEEDRCVIAQEKLHPSCARKPAGSAPMLCSRLAAACKEDVSCRPRLEFYEQACAVDSDTQRCAGSTAECRRAVLGILGTQLRNLCTCKASDPREIYTCMDWQRILWYNPCIVESQTDFHRHMLENVGSEEVTTTINIIMPTTVTMDVIDGAVVDNGRHPEPPVIHPTAYSPAIRHTPPYYPTHTTTLFPFTTPTTTTTTTTTTTATTTLPPKYCEKRHATDDTIDYIEEGWGKRFYKGEECSELCLCHAEEKLACSVLECVEARPCETDYAVYTHAAPAYQAARGECFCYSGAFICVRPPKGSYELNFGVFLFLGYSKAEEQLLRPYTKISLVEAAMNKLGDIVQDSTSPVNGSTCRLERLRHINENIILQATLEEYEDVRDNMSFSMLQKEKEACEEIVTELGQKINSHAQEVREDMALSVLILAEVQVHMPPVPDAAALCHCSPQLLLLLAALASLHHTLLAS